MNCVYIMENKIKVGIIGLITLLAAIGGTIYLTPEELDNAYFCLATEEIGIFYGGISGTGLSAYPYIENRSDYVRCKKNEVNSVWVSLKDYAEEQGINVLDLLVKEKKEEGNIVNIEYNGQEYSCVFTNKIVNDSIFSTSKCNKAIKINITG